jgi:ribulose-5-phosphate 4-epimerase/fuculose-1-phosphate aldolase
VLDFVCYHKYGIANDNSEECDALGRDLADKWLMIMHNHGLLSVGRTVGEAFYFLYTLENACKVQVDVMASSAEMILTEPEIVHGLGKYTEPPADGPNESVTRAWDAMIRMLDAQDPSYKD